MTVDVDVPSLYRGRAINLWVEDAVVVAYLREVWSDSEIHFLVAGGHEAVGTLTKQAEENKYRSVFGLVDRDFGESNYADWMTVAKTFRRFVLPVHELENLLLDPATLAGCVANDNLKSAEEIEHRMRQLATSLAPYMACRAEMTALRHLVLDGFMTHPHRDAVPDLVTAESLIVSSGWFGRVVAETQSEVSATRIRERLAELHQKYLADLDGDQWRQTFSGKELFKDICSYIYKGVGIHGQQRDIDVAKAVARFQVQNKSLPPVILELRQAMLQRLGR